MFLPTSVCLSAVLITRKLLISFFVNFYGMVGNNPGTNQLDLTDF